MTRILLATVDQTFPDSAIDEAVRRAGDKGEIYVVSAARIYGTAFGLPHPGLYPSKREREAHKKAVAAVVRACERAGREAAGEVMATRHAARMLARRAREHGCAEIVASAAPWSRMVMLGWAGEPYRLARRSRIPVHLVESEP